MANPRGTLKLLVPDVHSSLKPDAKFQSWPVGPGIQTSEILPGTKECEEFSSLDQGKASQKLGRLACVRITMTSRFGNIALACFNHTAAMLY